MYIGWDKFKYLCHPNNSDYRKKKKASAQVGQEAEEKHQGGQTAMKSLMLPASVEIGPANCPNPQQVLVPPKQGVGWGWGGGGGDGAKASPNVKWHLLNTLTRGCFHARVPGDLCGPSRSAKPGAAAFLFVLDASSRRVSVPGPDRR